MADEVSCPTCSGDLPLTGDERSGDEVFCTYCGAVCTMKGNASDEDCELQEDY